MPRLGMEGVLEFPKEGFDMPAFMVKASDLLSGERFRIMKRGDKSPRPEPRTTKSDDSHDHGFWNAWDILPIPAGPDLIQTIMGRKPLKELRFAIGSHGNKEMGTLLEHFCKECNAVESHVRDEEKSRAQKREKPFEKRSVVLIGFPHFEANRGTAPEVIEHRGSTLSGSIPSASSMSAKLGPKSFRKNESRGIAGQDPQSMPETIF